MSNSTRYLTRRNGVYYLDFWTGAKGQSERVKQSLRTKNLKEAKRKAAPILAARGLGTQDETLAAITRKLERSRREHGVRVADAWAAFLASPSRSKKSGESTLENYESQWTRFTGWLERTHPRMEVLADVTPAIAKTYASDLLEAGFSANTFKQHVQTIARTFDVLDVDPNPIRKARINTDGAEKEARRELTVDELKRVCGSATGEMRLLFALGLFAALRLADCATLKWSEVDLDRGRILRRPQKTARTNPSKVVNIPVHTELRALLEETPPARRTGYVLPETAEEYLRRRSDTTKRIQHHFHENGIETKGAINGARKRRPVRVGFHSLRHTFVSIARDQDAPLAVVEALVGHSNPAMTRHYTHVGDAATARAVAALPPVTTEAPAPPDTVTLEREVLADLAGRLNSRNWKDVKAELANLAKKEAGR